MKIISLENTDYELLVDVLQQMVVDCLHEAEGVKKSDARVYKSYAVSVANLCEKIKKQQGDKN